MKWLRAFFALVGLSIISTIDCIDEIQVDGDDFVSYKMGSRFIGEFLKRHTIALEFKTVHPDGMLIYIGSKDQLTDFAMLDLVQGKLRVTVNLGDNKPKLNGDLVMGSNLADNIWHVVELALEGRQLSVTVRRKTTRVVLKSTYNRLDMNGKYFFVGGLTKDVRDILQAYKPTGNFKGCLRDVYYHDYRVKILRVGSDKNISMIMKRYREYGAPQFSCPHVQFKSLSFGHPKASLVFQSKGSVFVNVKMHFRTYFPDGVLVSKGMALGNTPFIIVSLLGGEISLKVRVTIRGQVIKLNSGKFLNDGNWHYMSVVVNETVVRLKVDKPELTHYNPELKQAGKKNLHLFIGYSNFAPNFLGCIHNLLVDDREVNLFKSWANRHGNLQNGCFQDSNCFPNHCLHHGKCNEVRSGGFSCDCEDTFHGGRFCEKPIYQRTCQEYKNLGLAEDATCKVDPDGKGPLEPFKVLCNASDESHAITVVRHNKAGPQRISSGRFFHGAGYLHHLGYSVTDMKQIRELIGRSENCRQFVKFKCFASKIHPSGSDPVRWKGLHQSLISDHWPGAPAGSNKCACGVNGTCANPRYNCNCDIGDNTWREDEGYVTDKSNLPVTVLMFPQSTAPQSNITVGPLECFGALTSYSNASDEPLHLQQQAARFLYKLCDVLNPITPQPRLDVVTPYERPMVWWNSHITVPGKKASTRARTLQKLLTSKQSTTELLTTRSTNSSPEGWVLPLSTETARHVSSNARSEDPSSSSTTVSQFSTEGIGSDLPGNESRVLESADLEDEADLVFQDPSPDVVPTSSQLSWQIILTVVLLVVGSVMMVSAFGYFIAKQRRRRESFCEPFRRNKKPSLSEVRAGFPEVRLRPRSGELNLSDARRSIEAGSYNARTGSILYGERL